jgi:hypothetical protein
MNHSYDPDEDRDLPWDPMWAYVLGEDVDDRDHRDDTLRRNTEVFSRRDDSRDTADTASGGRILKKLWKRMERDAPASSSIPTHSRSVDREEWSWEIDTSQFSLMRNESDRKSNKTDFSDKKKWMSTSTKKIRDSIGTVWKDTQLTNGTNRSILSRKSS